MADELISVIIPTYNRAGLTREAVDSVLNQRWPALQVIVIDDGSTDDTAAAMAEYGDRIEYVYQENQGQAAARNHGFRLARGSVLTFLDSDDLWLPEKLEIEMAIFRDLPAADAIISDSEHFREGELVQASRFKKLGLTTNSGRPEFLPLRPPLWVNCSLVSTCCMTIRRSALDRLDPPCFDESRTVNEDWEFEVRMYHYCKVVLCPTIVAQIRRFPDGTRRGRTMPGFAPTLEHSRTKVVRHRNLMERCIRLPGLAPDLRMAVEAKLAEASLELDALDAEILATAAAVS